MCVSECGLMGWRVDGEENEKELISVKSGPRKWERVRVGRVPSTVY